MAETSALRRIAKTVTGAPAIDGAGVHLVRVIGSKDVKDFDPFLMLDAFDSVNPADYVKGFPWHPHRGIETVTYLADGEIEHGDSLGNVGSILAGGCQWMTAGSGIIHQEMPKSAPRMLGLQLWVNMPASRKMADPAYRDLSSDLIPVVTESGVSVAVIAGIYRGTEGSAHGMYVDATMLAMTIDAGSALEIPVPPDHTVFVYIIEGSLSFGPDGDAIASRTAVLLADGSVVRLGAAGSDRARCVLFSGPPLNEPIAWGGPIVMNTPEELERAFRELDEGTFIKHGAQS